MWVLYSILGVLAVIFILDCLCSTEELDWDE
jgi:hypothetical protein